MSSILEALYSSGYLPLWVLGAHILHFFAVGQITWSNGENKLSAFNNG